MRISDWSSDVCSSDLMRGFAIVLPLLVAGVVAAIVGPLALGGWNFSVKALRFDVARINPISGIGRMFSMQSLVELIKGVSNAALIGALGAAFLWQHRDDFLALTRMDTDSALAACVCPPLSLLVGHHGAASCRGGL